jgi:hypothetical protein
MIDWRLAEAVLLNCRAGRTVYVPRYRFVIGPAKTEEHRIERLQALEGEANAGNGNGTLTLALSRLTGEGRVRGAK